MSEKEKEMEKLKKECLEFCYNHSLYEKGTYPVFGKGSLETKIILIGESPGYWESQKGEPFVGAAGKVLDELLENVGIKREEIYITNLINIRPPNNRDPKPEEIKEFAPYLERQIEIIEPEVICSLGNFATRFIFKKYNLGNKLEGISKIHGKIFEPQVTTEDIQNSLFEQKRRGIKGIKIIPLYHPAVATYNANMKEILKKDFKILEKFN